MAQIRLINLNEVSCFGRSLWIPNRKFHLGAPVMYIVYCSLATDLAVSINATSKVGCCDWFQIQACTEVDDNTMC